MIMVPTSEGSASSATLAENWAESATAEMPQRIATTASMTGAAASQPIASAQAPLSAMAPMVTAGVVAADNELSPGLASAMIAVGVPLSLVTVPLWWHFMGLL